MKGKKIVKNQTIFLSIIFFVVFGFGIFFIWGAYNNSYYFKGMGDNEVIFLGLLLATFVYILNKIINKISDCYSDYLDYCDIEDVKNDLNKGENRNENFNNEIWNNINRRAEKAKIVSLSSIQFKEIQKTIEKLISKNIEK